MDKIVIYHTDDGKVDIKLYEQDGTIAMTQDQIAKLFQKNVSIISRHISSVIADGEL